MDWIKLRKRLGNVKTENACKNVNLKIVNESSNNAWSFFLQQRYERNKMYV